MNQTTGRVLIIVHDSPLRDQCAAVLRRAGFGVMSLERPAEAFEALARRSYDLLLLDLLPTAEEGLALLAELHERGLDVPTLLLSGAISVDEVARAMRLGARGLLRQPFAPDELRATALEIVHERRAVRSSDRAAALRPAILVGERLLGELDLPRLQDQIIAAVRSELEADRASLMLLEDDGQWLRIVACSGLPPHIQVGHRRPIGASLAGTVARRRQPVRVDASGEVSPSLDDTRGELFEDQIVSALSVPVLAGERLLGVLNAAKVSSSNSPPFSEADQELLMLLAAQAAIAIENARLYTQVAQSEARYRALLQHATDAVLLIDATGKAILDVNLALEQLSGYGREELLTMPPRLLLPDVERLAQVAMSSARGASAAGREAPEIETELRTRQEQAAVVAVSVSAVPHDGQQLVLVIARDVSERQRIAKQLVQAEKLAALGRLSASLAHEINNPLQAINNSVHLLLSRQLTDEKRQVYLSMTRDEIERLISIVQRMLDFYRPSREGMRPVDVNEILDTVLTLTESQLHERGVQIVREGEARLPRVFAISNHLKQVCFNLIFNAAEAMPDGGELRVRAYLDDGAAEDPDEASYVAMSGGRADAVRGAAVVIELGDSGMGIPAHDLPKIFEPFYTTRTNSTGLGLAVSYSIIEQHHGELAVRSAVGRGTTFRIRLPVAK